VKRADGETFHDGLGGSPASSADSGAEDEKSVHNSQRDQGTDDQYEERVEKWTSITRGCDGDPEAIVCVIVDFVGVLVAIAGSVNGKIECIFFVFS
jgi:hypothetical protein